MGEAAARYPGIVFLNGKSELKVALTFDDIPDPYYTPAILDILNQKNVQATFFVIGNKARNYPEIIKRIVDEGHCLANHSWDHPYLPRLSARDIQDQIVSTGSLLFNITGSRTEFFRPPYGAMNDMVITAANRLGYKIVLWSVDSNDWKGYPPERVLQNILGAVKPGAIILQHCGNDGTLKSLDTLIDTLRQRGYDLVTIPQLLQLESNPQKVIHLVVNGRELTAPVSPYLTDSNRTMVPLESTIKLLGCEIKTARGDTIIAVIQNHITVEFYNNSAHIYRPGNTRLSKIIMEEPVAVKQNNVMVPVRSLAKIMGLELVWHGKTKTVILTQP
nr:polysaccharide deacetylase family protein [Desulforadius tongensis]